MTEINEGTAKVAEEQPQQKTPVKIRCVMFFDGTLNNRPNIDSRIARNEFYQATLKRKYPVFGARVGPKGDGSYENDFTNVVTLDKHVTDNQPFAGYDVVIKVYTEGAGTINNEADRTRGYAFGTGQSGIEKKCEKGIGEAVKLILNSKVGEQTLNPDRQYIEKLTIDVCGFSRGAATARYCIHQVLFDEAKRIKLRLEKKGMETRAVDVCFAGLFDTVSSHGASVALSSSNDVKALKLDAVRYAAKVVQLAAGDEHRAKFSLTTVQSAGGKGEEYYMPGVHSDVGGSYLEVDTEDFYLQSSDQRAHIERDRDALISEGWYTQEQLSIEGVHGGRTGPRRWRLKANRSEVSNAYCNIPLKIMAKYAEDQKIPIEPDLRADAEAGIEAADRRFGTQLALLDSQIRQYMRTSRDAYQQVKTAPLVKSLRGRYVHMSATESTGMEPRFKDDPQQGRIRWREIYEG